MRLPRRGLLAWPLVLALPACGFRPLYARDESGAGAARDGLGLISVAIIPERTGQLLRQALQARFDHGDAPMAKRFDLLVSFGIASEAVGIQPDNTITRVRFVGQASWTLATRDAARSTVSSGKARAVDALNTFDQQYFAQDIEGETIQRRLAEAVADQITTQLAIYFDKHRV
jgi:LPS-assembly lipoprotein